MKKTLEQIALLLGAELVGEPRCEITAVSPFNSAEKGSISFINDSKYLDAIEQTNASALIVSPAIAETFTTEHQHNLLLMKDPYLGYAKVAQLFDTSPKPVVGISSQASIDASAEIGANVSIGAFVVIEAGVVIGDNCIIGAGVHIAQNCHIGDSTRIYPNSVIYHSVSIGKNCILHANTVIGSDGFGYANDKGTWIKIPQVGGVSIGNNVEIGAHTAIDRGALENTVIGNGVILDNHIHIAHNVAIGDNTAIAGCTAVAGSTSIGKNCTIAGRVSIIGHLTICDKVHLTACTFVNKSITKAGAYSSGTTFQTNKDWQKSAVRFRQLDTMWRKLTSMGKDIAQLDSKNSKKEKPE